MPEEAPRLSTSGRFDRRGCLVGLVLLVTVPLLLVASLWWRADRAEKAALAAQEVRATAEFSPALLALKRPPSAQPSRPAYDIDKTIRVINEIDLAVQNSDSLRDWLNKLSHEDYRDVAPEVLDARAQMLDVLMRLYARQVDVEDQAALWDFSAGMMLMSALSVVDVDGEVGPLSAGGSFNVDRAQARKLMDGLLDQQEEHARLVRELRRSETELMGATLQYSEVYYKYIDEWDRLSTVRDRAYLAAWNGDWDTAVSAADQAIAEAPLEREAHLVKALALIESGRADDPETAIEVDRLLGEYIDEHPDQTAPAFLLKGVLEARRGDSKEANLDLQQAAAYYPRQAASLTDMLDPYKARSYLRKSREGAYIIELYKTTMLGSGYFSPDLQMARLAFEQGDFEGGRRKVMDHFSRRRTQQQWDYILSDLRFCQDLLGADYQRIFPEDWYLDLVVKPAMLGSSLKLAVKNRSDRTLHNATLILAVQFTDMHPADYETFVAGETKPAVLAHETTDFGTTEIRLQLHGVDKTVDDIVTHRAILVSDEAVVWVDTDDYKIAETREFHGAAQAEAPAAARAAPRSSEARQSMADRVLADARGRSALTVDINKLSRDDVNIRLPKELAVLRPLFRLRNGEKLQTADENLIVGDYIELRFSGVDDFEGQNAQQFELVATTPLGDVLFTWNQDTDGSFRLDELSMPGPK